MNVAPTVSTSEYILFIITHNGCNMYYVTAKQNRVLYLNELLFMVYIHWIVHVVNIKSTSYDWQKYRLVICLLLRSSWLDHSLGNLWYGKEPTICLYSHKIQYFSKTLLCVVNKIYAEQFLICMVSKNNSPLFHTHITTIHKNAKWAFHRLRTMRFLWYFIVIAYILW